MISSFATRSIVRFVAAGTVTAAAMGCSNDAPEQDVSVARSSIISQARTVVVAVHPAVFDELTDELAQLETDMEDEGWNPIVMEANAPSAVALRNMLINASHVVDLAGAFFVGDLPTVRAHHPFASSYDTSGISDYYYMDLDGEWRDDDGDGAFEVHAPGNGDRGPEIFVGRLHGSNVSVLGKSEVEMFRDYFARNHAYRSGALPTRGVSLYSTLAEHHYGGYDPASAQWSADVLASQLPLRPRTRVLTYDHESAGNEWDWTTETWWMSNPEAKQLSEFRETLWHEMSRGLDHVAHGQHGGSTGWGSVFTSSDVPTLVAEGGQLPIFVTSNSCATAEINLDDAFGAVLTLAGSLAFVGPSESSSSLWTYDVAFNEALLNGTIGEAQFAVQEVENDALFDEGQPGYASVSLLLGDPTLALQPPTVAAHLRITSEWSSGYCAEVVVTNDSAATIDGWGVVYTTNDSTPYTQWNASFSEEGGDVLAESLSWNATIAPGGSQSSTGFCANKTGDQWRPRVVAVQH